MPHPERGGGIECDGYFSLISNEHSLSERDLLLAYKGQPALERRFTQLKTDFEVAPVYLQEVSRIGALLCVYFFVLLVEALLERELRRAMARSGQESLPLYSEGRACRRPTARRVIDLFEEVQRHELTAGINPAEFLTTELTPLQRKVLRLLACRSGANEPALELEGPSNIGDNQLEMRNGLNVLETPARSASASSSTSVPVLKDGIKRDPLINQLFLYYFYFLPPCSRGSQTTAVNKGRNHLPAVELKRSAASWSFTRLS